MKKQIEEMAKAIKFCRNTPLEVCQTKLDCGHCIAEQIYNEGYRKQEWISVEERLPENDYDKHWKDRKRYLVFNEPCGIMFVATYGYKEHDWWVNGDHLVLGKWNYREVTHWMPMPEPPKGE